MADFLLGSAFLAALYLPMSDSLFSWDNTESVEEGRLLANRPLLSTLNLYNFYLYPARLEAYCNDHFGLRNLLIRWHHGLKVKWLGISPVSRAILGKEDWLFKADADSNKYIRHVELFTEAQMEQWRLVLEARRDHLAKGHCAFLFALIPDKASLYPEYLPNWSRPLQPVSRMDQLMDHLEAHSDLNLLDLRPAMHQAKAEGVYLLHDKTDSHWTHFGAYLAAREIILNLADSFPALEARPIDPGSIEYGLGAGGDLARMLGLEYEMMEERVYLEPLDGFRARMVDDLSPPPRLLPLYQKPVVMVQEDRPDLPRAIVYGDSFNRASLFHQYLSDAFHRAVFADVRHADFDPDFIEREYPDVVILILVARRLQLDPPAQAFTRNW